MPAFPDKTPPINASGKYILRAPFSADPAINYKCEAINGFEALAERGINVFSAYYNPVGLTQSIYEGDRAAGINIVTLMSQGGDVIHVPSSYILSYPNQLAVPYGRIILAVDLGPLPSDFPLDDLKAEIISTALSITGNAAITVSTHVSPIAAFVDNDLAKNLNTARVESIKDMATPYLSKLTTQDQLEKANNKISALEGVVKNLMS